MVTLSNIQGSTLAANVRPQLRGIGEILERQRNRREDLEREQRKQDQIRDLIGGLIGIGQPAGQLRSNSLSGEKPVQATGQFETPEEIQRHVADITPPVDPKAKHTRNQAALLRLTAIDPKIGKAVMDIIAKGDIRERERLRLMAERRAKEAVFISSQKDFASKQRALTSLATATSARGEPIQAFVDLQNLSEPELDLELLRMKTAGQDLQQVLKRRKGFTLSPGEQRFDAEGRLIAVVPAKPEKRTERDKKIADLMSDFGMTAPEARDIVDGRKRLVTDPLTGQDKIVNIATGEVTLLTAPVPRAAPDLGARAPAVAPDVSPAEVPFAEQTVFDVLPFAVGAGPVFQEAISGIGGQFSPALVNRQVTQARTKIRGLRERLITALAQSGRVSNQEQQRILENIPQLGIFESPGRAEAQLTELHGRLSRTVLSERAVAADRNIPTKIREDAIKSALAMESILAELGPPPQAPVSISTQEEFNALPPGTRYIDSQTGAGGRKQ